MLKIVVFIIYSSITLTQETGYENFTAYRVMPAGQSDLMNLADFVHNKHFDFWSPMRNDGQPFDVMMDEIGQTLFKKAIENTAITYKILVDDVRRALQTEESTHTLTRQNANGEINFQKYHSHFEINAYLDKLAQTYPNFVTIENIGKSFEGRSLKIIKLSSNPSVKKPIILIDAGIHAREWITPTVVLYAIKQLVEGPKDMMKRVDWHLLPVLNPDGYEYSHKNLFTRLWRKTRSGGPRCYGTDGNRNFDYHWAENGSSYDTCSDQYHGPSPFSEMEMKAFRNYIHKYKKNIKLYLTFHSYGKLIMYPWGYSRDLPEDSHELHRLGERVAKTIENYSGTKYKVGSSGTLLYVAAGGSDDWVKAVAGVNLSYTIELPGGWQWFGFGVPSNRILPIAKETWEGLKTFHLYVSAKYS